MLERGSVVIKSIIINPVENHLESFGTIRPLYLEALKLVERLHKGLVDVIKDALERKGRSNVNPTQALLVYGIVDKEFAACELRTRGYYLGSNVSYNLKKLVEMGFVNDREMTVDQYASNLLTRAVRCAILWMHYIRDTQARWSKGAESKAIKL